MSERSVTHATFVLERTYDASPATVFSAWADPAAKARWFAEADGWTTGMYEVDFRVGGHETYRGGPKGGGQTHRMNGQYQDIIPNARIIYTYDMHLNDTRISVSLATIELEPSGAGTRLILTEQGAYLDGYDSPDQRKEGTGSLLDALAAEIQRQTARA